MAAFVAQSAVPVAPVATAASGLAPVLRGGAATGPAASAGTAAFGAGLVGTGLAAAVAPAAKRGRAVRKVKVTRLQARGGSSQSATDVAQVAPEVGAEKKQIPVVPESKNTALIVSEGAGNAMVSSEPNTAAEDDEDISSRVRYIAPLLPLAIFPIMTAKDNAQRNMELMVSTSPPGSQMYNMTGWTPDVKSPCYESIYRWFPKAMPASPVFERSKLFMNRLGMAPTNTIFGSSLCPDEINNKRGGTLDQMTKYWGEQFPLGGLGGVPLVGKTGWGAFSHHVPDSGNIFVIYGPHVGVSEQGQVGKILRPGQDEVTSACGAFVGAYKQTENWKGPEDMDGLDMQQQFIRNNLGPMRPQIATAQNPMAELANKAFSIVDKQMLSIIDLECCDKLVLLGGIQVNTPEGYPDHFAPMRFEVREKGKPTQSLMKAFNPALDPNEIMKNKAA